MREQWGLGGVPVGLLEEARVTACRGVGKRCDGTSRALGGHVSFRQDRPCGHVRVTTEVRDAAGRGAWSEADCDPVAAERTVCPSVAYRGAHVQALAQVLGRCARRCAAREGGWQWMMVGQSSTLAALPGQSMTRLSG